MSAVNPPLDTVLQPGLLCCCAGLCCLLQELLCDRSISNTDLLPELQQVQEDDSIKVQLLSSEAARQALAQRLTKVRLKPSTRFQSPAQHNSKQLQHMGFPTYAEAGLTALSTPPCLPTCTLLTCAGI